MPISFEFTNKIFHAPSPWLDNTIQHIDDIMTDQVFVRTMRWYPNGKEKPGIYSIKLNKSSTPTTGDISEIKRQYMDAGWLDVEINEDSGIYTVHLFCPE